MSQGYGSLTRYHAGQSETKIKGSNCNFQAGVDLPMINLRAQASYSHNTEETWNFHAFSTWCGSTSQGPAGSPEAAANNAAGCPTAPPGDGAPTCPSDRHPVPLR